MTDVKISGNKATITIDFNVKGTPSKSGKSNVHSTTGGNVPVIGNGKTMYPFGDIVDGNNGNNYIITYVLNFEGIMTPLLLIPGITAADKVYDGRAPPGCRP